MKIIVKQKHINAGKRVCASLCPIALAISDAVDLPSNLIVATRDYIRVDDERFKTPQEVNAFIKAFDNGAYVKPFEFEMGEKW